MWYPYEYTEEQLIDLSKNGNKRVRLKSKFATIYATNKNSYDQNTKTALDALFNEIEILEKALLDKITKKSKVVSEPAPEDSSTKSKDSIEIFLHEHPDLVKKKDELEKNDLAAWALYKESIDLATSLIEENPATVIDEITLLGSSIAFTSKVVRNEMSEESNEKLNEANEISVKIDNLLKTKLDSKEIAEIEKRKRWQKFAMGFAAILFIAAITVLATTLTFGAAIPAAALVAGIVLYFAGFFTGAGLAIGAGAKHLNLNSEKAQLLKSTKNLHTFHRSVEEHAKEVIKEERKKPKPTDTI